MAERIKKISKKKIPNEIWAIVIAFGVGLFLNYVNASIHIWGTVLGIWVLMILYELMDLKKQLKK
ncbi:MAG: hypothetical protein KKF68_01935 [Nanoarchaeota archaeon]|nr:hypothetical protein [Nanoarchaeota archaeon]